MNLANMITVGRILSVPLIVWCLLIEARMAAFVIFIVAGISDSVDGIIARHFDQDTELGAYLDPIADKGLLISVFVVLGYLGHIPLWLVVLAVSRDVLIVAGVMLAFLLGSPMDIKPLFVSKANTAIQIFLISVVMGALAFTLQIDGLVVVLVYCTGALTVLSAFAYLQQWTRHVAEG